MLKYNKLSAYQQIVYGGYGPYIVHGAAGTGKSFPLRMIAFGLKQQGIEPIILASTGVVAFSIGGQIIHRFFGISVSD